MTQSPAVWKPAAARRCLRAETGGVVRQVWCVRKLCRQNRQLPQGWARYLAAHKPGALVRRGASLDPNQTYWQFLEERQDGATLQLAADDHLASSINAVHLKDRFGDVETDCRDRLQE
jgi:hypothetical protein